MPVEQTRHTLGNEFRPQVYSDTSKERAGVLQSLYDAGEHVLALYVAGVAVESMFRGFRARFDPNFDSRHDLYLLAASAKFSSLLPRALELEYAANLGSLYARWSNNHRFRSEVAMRQYLKRAKLDRGIKGDYLKENSRVPVNAAIELVSLGAKLWKLKN